VSQAVEALVRHFRQIHEETFRGLPIANPMLEVEAVGMRKLDEHDFGVLITPWFMNLVLLPGSDRWDQYPQGSVAKVKLPGGTVDFTVGHDEVSGTMLTAALFSCVADFPDQSLAREVAREALRLLFSRPQETPRGGEGKVSRRDLFQRHGGTEGEGR
jgi:[NiFe] hydrogenase assembly HybE family chaperone